MNNQTFVHYQTILNIKISYIDENDVVLNSGKEDEKLILKIVSEEIK